MASLSIGNEISATPENPATEVNLEELQAQLATMIDERDAALAESRMHRSRLESTFSSTVEEPCLFIEQLPIEIRRQIYALLLTNNVLSEWSSMSHNAYFTSWQQPSQPPLVFDYTPKYGLSPALLRTCRQIYEEGCEVLYGCNKFIVDCSVSGLCHSPVVRSFPEVGRIIASHCRKAEHLIHISAVKKVQHWRIFLSSAIHTCLDPIPQNLRGFCEAIRDSPPKSMQVLIIPQGASFFYNYSSWVGVRPKYHKIELLLQPLRILRNIPNFEVRSANIGEVRNFNPSANQSSIEPLTIASDFESGLKSLVQGSEPNVSILKMYNNLLRYAQGFEQHPRNRNAMNQECGFYRSMYRHADDVDDENMEDVTDFVPKGREEPRFRSYNNPYTHGVNLARHPVERLIGLAGAGYELQNPKMFKRARASILVLLEPQYQRILAASRNLADLVKDYKVSRGLLDASIPRSQLLFVNVRSSAAALMVLEDYARAFARDMPEYLRIDIRSNKRAFESGYSILYLNRLMDHLGLLLENGYTTNTQEFNHYFKLAADELDRQYLQIRAARKALFEHDIGDWGCELDLQLGLVDEMIDWNVNEPNMTPQNMPEGWDPAQNQQDDGWETDDDS